MAESPRHVATAWSATVTGALFGWVALVSLVATALASVPLARNATAREIGIVVVLALVFVIALVFVRLRVTADQRGLRVVSSLSGIPLKSIRLDDIDTVRAEILEPLYWGGWGFRVIPGRSAVILRSGPGIVVNLRNGKQFAVSVDEPEGPTAVLTTLSERFRPG